MHVMRKQTMSNTTERLWRIVEPWVAAEGVELDDLEVRGEGPGTIVRVTVDSDGEIGVDRIARISRGLSRLLDDDDPFAGSYTLEVSSPGLERRLRRPRHYEKSVGREVKVKTTAAVAGSRVHRGPLKSADGEGFVVAVDGDDRRIEYGDVASAHTVFVWEKAAKPGKRR
jgi:ribosome maturation factor RimP